MKVPGPRRDASEEMAGGSSEIGLDLHAVIDKMLLLKSDLQAFHSDRAGDGELAERQREQIAFSMRQVRARTDALEDILMRMGCPVVVVSVNGAQRERLRSALHVFDRLAPIDEAEPFEDVLCAVVTVLNAADIVGLRAAGGRPGAVRRRAAQVERIATTAGSGTGIVLARIVPKSVPQRDEVEQNLAPTRNVAS